MRSLPWWKLTLPALLLAAAAPASRADVDAASLKGTYFALLEGESFETSGYVKITAGANRHGTITVKLGTEKACVAGYVWNEGKFAIFQLADPDMTIDLAPVQMPDGTIVVSGTVSDDGTVFPVTAAKLATTAAAPGPYTFVLGATGSADAGFGTLQVDAKGKVRLAGTLSNGANFSAGGQLNQQGKFDLVSNIKGEVLSGTVTLASTGTADISATLHRRKAARGNAPASDQTITLTGSTYSQVYYANAQSVKLTIEPAGVTPILHSASLSSRGTYIITDAGGDSISLTLAKSNGLLSGKFKLAGKSKNLRGVVLQSSQSANGFVQGGGTFNFTSASLTDSSGMIKTGSGTLTLGGSNTNTGATTINSGTLVLNNGGNLNTGFTGGVLVTNPGLGSSGGVLTVNQGTVATGNGILNTSVINTTYSGLTLGSGMTLGSTVNLSGSLSSTSVPLRYNTWSTFGALPWGTTVRLTPGATVTDSQGYQLSTDIMYDGEILYLWNSTFLVSVNDGTIVLTMIEDPSGR